MKICSLLFVLAFCNTAIARDKLSSDLESLTIKFKPEIVDNAFLINPLIEPSIDPETTAKILKTLIKTAINSSDKYTLKLDQRPNHIPRLAFIFETPLKEQVLSTVEICFLDWFASITPRNRTILEALRVLGESNITQMSQLYELAEDFQQYAKLRSLKCEHKPTTGRAEKLWGDIQFHYLGYMPLEGVQKDVVETLIDPVYNEVNSEIVTSHLKYVQSWISQLKFESVENSYHCLSNFPSGVFQTTRSTLAARCLLNVPEDIFQKAYKSLDITELKPYLSVTDEIINACSPLYDLQISCNQELLKERFYWLNIQTTQSSFKLLFDTHEM